MTGTRQSPRIRWGGGIGRRFVDLRLVRNRVPARYRPTLYFESLYNVGFGAFIAFSLLTPFALKTVVGGTERELALFGAMIGGSSLLSPLVSYLGRKISMRSLVVVPNLIVACLLLATAIPFGGANVFTLIVGSAFVVQAFPRVAEMNMYRINYPATHRGAAVGWIKGIASIAGLALTLLGYWWFSFQPERYWMVYCFVAVMLFGSTLCYARIPLHRNNVFVQNNVQAPHRAFWEGLKIFVRDRRFLLFQLGFAMAGFANHMSMVFVAEVLTEDVIAGRTVESLMWAPLHDLLLTFWQPERQVVVTLIVGFVVAVGPYLFMMSTSPFWGRVLDRINPMIGRSIFNTFQGVAYACYGYGGLTLQIWPFLVGTVLHAIGLGGGQINWLTGSLYFAPKDRISLYNAVHVGLTGLRGMIAPLCGWYLISSQGLNLRAGLFCVSSVLSLMGAIVMLAQGLADPGTREAGS